jgi:hypothetical protein
LRAILIAWLMGILIFCPQVCGTDVSDQAAHHLDAEHSEHGPAPSDADDCICQGAVPIDQVRVPDAGSIRTKSPFLSLVPPIAPLRDQHDSDRPTGEMSRWGTALASRAILQNFRC